MAKKKTTRKRKGEPMSFRFYQDGTLDMLRVLADAGSMSLASKLEGLIREAFWKAKESPTKDFSSTLKEYPHLK
jgi:hypothetical protein